VATMADAGAIFQHLDFWLDIEHLSQREYVETRSAFDAGVLRLAMRNATDEELDRLEAAAEAMASAPRSDLDTHHDLFHQGLLDATHNRFLAALTIILYRTLWHLAAHAPNVRLVPPPDQLHAHRALVAGLRRRDEAEIPHLVALHLGQEETP